MTIKNGLGKSIPFDHKRRISVADELTSNSHTIVTLLVEDGSGRFYVRGASKCSPEDKMDSNLGLKLAFARAVEAASRRLNRRALGHIRHNDELARQTQYRLDHPKELAVTENKDSLPSWVSTPAQNGSAKIRARTS